MKNDVLVGMSSELLFWSRTLGYEQARVVVLGLATYDHALEVLSFKAQIALEVM